MHNIFDTPILNFDEAADASLISIANGNISFKKISEELGEDKLFIFQNISFEKASSIFKLLVEYYGLRDSYNIQMQYVAHLIKDRKSVNNVAVTVNERGPYSIIQSHSEGDTTSPLDIFGIYCKSNSTHGGENVLSLVNQKANFSRVKAKEKAFTSDQMTPEDLKVAKSFHPDCKRTIDNASSRFKTIFQLGSGSVVVAPFPLQPSQSKLRDSLTWTLWDNVTVHDVSFHKYMFQLLDVANLVLHAKGVNFQEYIYIEEDSDWAPVDTTSSTLPEVSELFTAHLAYKLRPGDFILLNNKIWTHGVNNFPPTGERNLMVMYG